MFVIISNRVYLHKTMREQQQSIAEGPSTVGWGSTVTLTVTNTVNESTCRSRVIMICIVSNIVKRTDI